MGLKHHLGKKHSEETKVKMKESVKNRKRQKMTVTNCNNRIGA